LLGSDDAKVDGTRSHAYSFLTAADDSSTRFKVWTVSDVDEQLAVENRV